MLCSYRHSRASFFLLSLFPSLSARVFPLLLFLSLLFSSHLHLLALLVAPGSAAINLLNDDATTHLFFTLFRSFSHTFLFCLSHALSHSTRSHTRTILIVYVSSLVRLDRVPSLSHRTHDAQFFTCLCVCVRSFLFSFVCVSV